MTRYFGFAVLVLLPGRAEAHAFAAGQSGYNLFLDGASLPFHTPELSLAVSALGLLIGLWSVNGLPQVWPFLMMGAVAGLALPWVALVDPTLGLYVLAFGLSLLGVLRRTYSASLMRALTAVAGGTIAYGALALHGLDRLPVMIPIGIFVGLNFFVAAIAGLASLPQRRYEAAWPLIGLRIVASWLVALTIMMFAFVVRQLF